MPEIAPSALLRRGIGVTVVPTPGDHTWFVDQRGPEGLRRLQKKGFRPELVPTAATHHDVESSSPCAPNSMLADTGPAGRSEEVLGVWTLGR